MAPNDSAAHPLALHEMIDAFEEAQHKAGPADLADHLPPPDDPLFQVALRELVRVDLEYSWKRQQPSSLEEYCRRFPMLLDDPDSLREITFEDYRLRKRAGQNPDPAEYQRRFHVNPAHWPNGVSRDAPAMPLLSPAASSKDNLAGVYRELVLWQNAQDEAATADPARKDDAAALLFSSLDTSNPEALDQLAQALSSLPPVGSEFLSFRLLAELGQGAFSKVYLAQQGDLANRLVALKVSSDLSGEWQTLAQLQHTHIVPIYSVHHAAPLQAVCMPYLGSTTLADFLGYITRQPTMPESGQCLLSTLQEHGSPVSEGLAVRLPAVEPSPAAEKPAARGWRLSQGVTALARLKQLTYEHTVLWLAARLADGLAHAHDRGILHRDLKPANILLTDDGQPMLLDFNLSANATLRDNPFAACVGGTLPYMAPEHLEAFSGADRVLDERSDVYALGIILFELLAGRSPFPRHTELPFNDMLKQMVADRQMVPRVRSLNAGVSQSMEAIVSRCLEPLPARRYQSAHDLHDDLQCQLEDRPLHHAADPSWRERLAKWARRHPRLSSSTTVGLVASLLLLMLGAAHAWSSYRSLARQDASETLAWFQAELRTAKFLLNTQIEDPEKSQAGMSACQRILDRYRVLATADWQVLPQVSYLPTEQQPQLQADMGEVLWLSARTLARRAAEMPNGDELRRQALERNIKAEACFPASAAPAAIWQQRALLYRSLKQPTEAAGCAKQAEATTPTPQDREWQAADLVIDGRYGEALTLLQQLTVDRAQSFWPWFLRGICHERLAQDGEAVAAYNACTALWPDYPWSYYNRGLARLKQHLYSEALTDFHSALSLQPGTADIYLHRALAYQGLQRYGEAIQDLTAALASGGPPVRIYFMRARIHMQAGNPAAARADRALGFREEPSDEQGWLARGLARLPDDPDSARGDFRRALEVNPRSLAALQNLAHVLAQQPEGAEEAIQTLTRAIELYPDYAPARSGRGVLFARQGKREKAHEDAQSALLRDSRPPILFQVAGIFALTSPHHPRDRLEAFRLLSTALRQGYGQNLIETDSDLDPVRSYPEFARLLEAARAVQALPPNKR